MLVFLPSWPKVACLLFLLTVLRASDLVQNERLIAFRHACNRADLRTVKKYLELPGFLDSLGDDDCAEFMATAIHSAIYGHPRGFEIMNLLACHDRFRALGPLGTTVVEKAMSVGNADLTIHILSNFEVDPTAACQGLVAAAKEYRWNAITALFNFYDDNNEAELTEPEGHEDVSRHPVVWFEASALRDFLILTSDNDQFGLFWKAVEVARETGSVDLVQFLQIIDEGMHASTKFDQLAAFVNLLMNDADVYAAYLKEHRGFSLTCAGQFLRVFTARNIIMDSICLPDELGNNILDVNINGLMKRILARNREEALAQEYPSSSYSSSYSSGSDHSASSSVEHGQVNETFDEDGDEDLAPPVIAAPPTGMTDPTLQSTVSPTTSTRITVTPTSGTGADYSLDASVVSLRGGNPTRRINDLTLKNKKSKK